MSAKDLFTQAGSAYTTYRGTLQVRDRIVGGVPLDTDTIKGWLKARLDLGDRELIELTEQTAAELGDQIGERPSADDLLEAVARAHETVNGFKKVDGTLVYEGRCLKAAIKESANVAYPGTKFPGKPAEIRKGLMRYLEERVFVDEVYLDLGVGEASGREQKPIHVMTPQGPRSAIKVFDYVERPTIAFTVKVLNDCIPDEVWGNIWQVAEEIGIGADRAQSAGKFDLLSWEKVS
jgi:hypothetical protein